MYELIKHKRESGEHSKEEIQLIVNSFIDASVPDYQNAASLMAVYLNGMTNLETAFYTQSLTNSGKKVKFDNLNGPIVDKHSTGGVGDKVSLILGPILAACNCYVPMIVGRSLAHTGGTLDKLESIKGYNGDIDINQFKKKVEQNRISIIGQNKDICPADKYIYAIRDVTATIDSLPLICGSIISKKKAEGIKGLILDIKVGNGAFMKTINDANELGKALTNLANELSIKSKFIVSDMNQPLGKSAGLWCEVQESIDFLKNNKRDANLNEVVFKICKEALKISEQKKVDSLIANAIESGKAYEIFEKMIFSHNGDLDASHNENIPKYSFIYNSPKEGYINKIDTEKIGYMLLEIGGGRKTTKDKIDPSCGLRINKKLGDKVDYKEPIIEIFGAKKDKIESVKKMFDDIIFISNINMSKKILTIYE